MPKVRANGIEIGYETHGQGEPMVLISGIGYDRWEWHRMVPGLSEHFRVIVFDNRGVGETDKPPGPYTPQLMAADVAGLLGALGIPGAVVVGHSMGGFIAQALALDWPEMVSRLVLASTNYGGPEAIPTTPEAMRVLTDTSSDPLTRFRRGLEVSTAPGFAQRNPEVINGWMEYRLRQQVNPQAYMAQLEMGLELLKPERSFKPRLAEVKAPTLILFGEADQVVPPGNAELLYEAIPHSRVVLLPGAGHFFPIETPEAAIEAIVAFVQGTSQGV